jgi:hypothetical protein
MPEYRAPICEDDRHRVPTPIGEVCYWCEEPIVEGDRGIIRPWVQIDESIPTRPIHIECDLRSVIGPVAFLNGKCKHAGGTEPCFDHNLTARQDALASWKWMREHGTLSR